MDDKMPGSDVEGEMQRLRCGKVKRVECGESDMEDQVER